MLTIKINDSHLEKRIAKKAMLMGKSTQETVKDLLLKALPEINKKLHYQQLNPKENGYIILNEKKSTTISDEEQTPFSHVDDTEKYVEDLRKNVWRKL